MLNKYILIDDKFLVWIGCEPFFKKEKFKMTNSKWNSLVLLLSITMNACGTFSQSDHSESSQSKENQYYTCDTKWADIACNETGKSFSCQGQGKSGKSYSTQVKECEYYGTRALFSLACKGNDEIDGKSITCLEVEN